MSLDRSNGNGPERLLQKLQGAQALSPGLMSELIAKACPRLALLPRGGMAARIATLVEQAAWVEIGLALIAVELPGWQLRRLAYDGGEWHCALSKQPNLPVQIDDGADAHHPVLPLAIVCALLEAQSRSGARQVMSVPQVRPAPTHAVCCDNFA
jgi:hypothetical protein